MRTRIFLALVCGLTLWGTGSLANTATAQPRHATGGMRIVAERHSEANGGNGEIVSVNPDGTHLRVLTTGHDDTDPDLSPDGRLVTFARCVRAVKCDEVGRVNVYRMRSDGTHVRALTHCFSGSDCLGSFTPAFSPDGRFIAFSRDQLNAAGTNFQGIFVMRSDGTHLRRVTSNGPNNLPDVNPRFSPDGHRLVFARELRGGGSQLFTVDVDGSHLRKLLPGVTGFSPDWGPHRHRVAFTWSHSSTADPVVDVATVHVRGRRPRPLTATAGTGTFAFAPDYSPNGARLVFSRSDDQGCTLVTVSARGGALRPVETGGGCTVNPSWSMRAHRRHH